MTDRQWRFVDLYSSGLNASRSAREAGYSARTAGQIAHELLKKPEIRAAIALRLEQCELTASEATQRLSAQARGLLPTRVREVLSRDNKVVLLREFNTHKALDKIASMLGLYDHVVNKEPLRIVVLREQDETAPSAGTPGNDTRGSQARDVYYTRPVGGLPSPRR